MDARNDYGSVPEAGAFDTGHPDAGAFDSGLRDAGPDANEAACVSQNNCINATLVQSMSGDTGSDSRTETGHTSQWLQVLVTENDHSVIGRQLHLNATLTSQPGSNYDLYLYMDEYGDETTRACGPSPSVSSTNSGGMDTADLKWGDGFLGNSNPDDRIVSIEIRHVSGPCNPTGSWTLSLTGN